MHPVSQTLEVGAFSRRNRFGCAAGKKPATQLPTILILADQLADILAAGAVATLPDLFVDEGLHGVRQGNVHGALCGTIPTDVNPSARRVYEGR